LVSSERHTGFSPIRVEEFDLIEEAIGEGEIVPRAADFLPAQNVSRDDLTKVVEVNREELSIADKG
jgi:hypothetical protein